MMIVTYTVNGTQYTATMTTATLVTLAQTATQSTPGFMTITSAQSI